VVGEPFFVPGVPLVLDRKGLGDAGPFDQKIVEALLFGQAPNLHEEVIAQRATYATIAKLDEPLRGMREV